MLGSALVPELVESGHSVVVTDIQMGEARPWGADGPTMGFLDVRRPDDVMYAAREIQPDLVVHLAAETSLEVCELNPDYAAATNVLGTKHVTLAARLIGAPIAYISTAGVFDGTKDGSYVEFDDPNPINVYGRTKLAGERIVETLHPEHYIVRAGWMIGGGPNKDHKFVSRIVDQVRSGAPVVWAVGDKLGSPTYAGDFAACFQDLVSSGSFGLYHMCGSGSASRYDVARAILDILGADEVELVEVGSDHFKEEFFVPRPRSEQMENLMLRLQGMDTMRPWREALESYLSKYYAAERQPQMPLVAR
jgi:dTDP-4-dehydrorhamnose reductase